MQEIREGALDVHALAEQIEEGVEPLRLKTRRLTANYRAGKSDKSEGAPFAVGKPTAVAMTPNR